MRREWFATFVSRDASVNPAGTACTERLTPQQLATYNQATVRIMSAWYSVSVTREDIWLSLWGECGGALQLCLQVGAVILIGLDLAARVLPDYKNRIVRFVSGSGSGGGSGEEAPATAVASFTASPASPRKHGAAAGRPANMRGAIDRLVLSSLSGSGAGGGDAQIPGHAGTPTASGYSKQAAAQRASKQAATLWRRTSSGGAGEGRSGEAPAELLSLSGSGSADGVVRLRTSGAYTGGGGGGHGVVGK